MELEFVHGEMKEELTRWKAEAERANRSAQLAELQVQKLNDELASADCKQEDMPPAARYNDGSSRIEQEQGHLVQQQEMEGLKEQVINLKTEKQKQMDEDEADVEDTEKLDDREDQVVVQQADAEIAKLKHVNNYYVQEQQYLRLQQQDLERQYTM